MLLRDAMMALAVVGPITACTGSSERSGGEAAAEPGRILSAPAPDTDGVLRVLVYHDMEGLSGQDDPRTFGFRHRDYYPRGREMLTGDVNAVIAGLYDGGADEVHVVDAHGSGNPEPDLLLDRLDSRARMVFREAPFRQYVDLTEPDVYDAIAVVGMHAKTGSGGFASHTYNIGTDIIMNGMSITETELIGYSWGRVGVPVIFGSGDDRLAGDLETMPWIEFVTVKRATSASTAELRPVEQVRGELVASAKRALEGRDRAQVMALTTPVRAALRVVPPARLDMLADVPGLDYRDQQVSFEAPDFGAAYDGVIGLIRVARGGYTDVLLETIAGRRDGGQLRANYSNALTKRWFDFESGRWTPSPAPSPPQGRRYHGAN